MPNPQTVIRGNDSDTATYELAPGVFQYIESVLIEVDNTAGGEIRPTLAVQTQDGQVIATKRQGESIAAGDTGSATWALRLTDESRAGDYVLIQEIVLDAPGPISFTAIPQTFRHLELVLEVRGAGFGSNQLGLAFNGDNAGANYTTVWGFVSANGGVNFTPNALPVGGNPEMYWQFTSSSVDPADEFSHARISVPYYTSDKRKQVLIEMASVNNATWYAISGVGFWFDTQAVTQIDLYEAQVPNADFAAGSKVSLYGIR